MLGTRCFDMNYDTSTVLPLIFQNRCFSTYIEIDANQVIWNIYFKAGKYFMPPIINFCILYFFLSYVAKRNKSNQINRL